MNRHRRPWVLYALFLAVALGAMGWVTRLALKAEQAELQARARTLVEEKVRLSLWRLDSTMALFLAPESARPWHQFETFHREGGTLVPSPILAADDPMVLLRFEIGADGQFTAPLVPTAPWDRLARRVVDDSERMGQAKKHLQTVQRTLSLKTLRQALSAQGAVLLTRDQARAPHEGSRGSGLRMNSPYAINLGVWTPFWWGDELFLARQVWVGDRELLQVTWLEWAGVREVLNSTFRDLLPEGELVPVKTTGVVYKDRRMGSLPLRLEPGHLRVLLPGDRTPARAALGLGWLFAVAGAIAGGLVLRHALDLGARRGVFATAVSHELRTPLTTFRLYTELLAKGMVTDPAEQQELLDTLLQEANRLDHLVKNVMAFARLEAGRDSSWETLCVASILEGPKARLEERARAAGLGLETKMSEALGGKLLRTDPLVVEQILFNLVDNASKYAAGGRDTGVQLEVAEDRGHILFRVIDHGPGVDPADQENLFRPFHKSVQKAARTAPGLGLGLALSRSLARSLGGDLRLDPKVKNGAAFELTLPLA